MTTPRDFAVALLAGLNLPLSQNNVDAMVSAEAIEGGFMNNTATYNPLNVTQPITGSTTASGFGPGTSNPANIQAYPNWPVALSATIALFKNGLYGDILSSFQTSAPPSTTLEVWAKNSHYGWTFTPSVDTSYGAETFPQGPSSLPLPPTVVNPSNIQIPSMGPSVAQAGVGAVLMFGFWKLYEYLGKR
jgi:hypothetical protein